MANVARFDNLQIYVATILHFVYYGPEWLDNCV